MEYLVIARIVQDHLAIPAIKVLLKRVFSVRANLVTKKRNRLLPQTVREVLYLRDASVIVEAEDSDSEV